MILPARHHVGDPDGHHRAHGARARGRHPRRRSSSSACAPRASTDRGVFRHVVKNAAPTALAVMGLQLGYLLGGSILIETVFSWPGTGFLLNAAIFQRDLPLLQGTILVLALFFVRPQPRSSTWCRRRSTRASSGADRWRPLVEHAIAAVDRRSARRPATGAACCAPPAPRPGRDGGRDRSSC